MLRIIHALNNSKITGKGMSIYSSFPEDNHDLLSGPNDSQGSNQIIKGLFFETITVDLSLFLTYV